MKRLWQAIVEPVLGTLLNYMAMRKVNTQGLELAHKGMRLAAMAYNLQKLLRFTPKTSLTAVMALPREEQGTLFWLFFVGREERILGKGIGIRRYFRVVQQPHRSVYSLTKHPRPLPVILAVIVLLPKQLWTTTIISVSLLYLVLLGEIIS
jgi:hypothetical protein